MPEATFAERDVTPEQVASALRGLLRELHAADGSLMPARVLNLVVIVDREWKGEIANRLERVGRYHASRTILLAVGEHRTQIDARLSMSSAAGNGGLGVLRERVELDLGPSHLEALETVVDPILVPELPTVLWSPHSLDAAVEALLPIVDVILIDSDDPASFDGAWAGMRRAAELCGALYVVDLAWLRTTPWRERLAAAFDDPSRRARLEEISEVHIRHNPDSLVSAMLLAGWLCARLGWTPQAGRSGGDLPVTAVAQAGSRAVSFRFDPVDQDVRGIAGVTVRAEDRFSLSLDRTAGGMVAVEVTGGRERSWRVLGASRGEGGILGEGVRQALLRDPTYGPALAAARSFEG
jgi:glucose-6-phosphate dehydrogenase assembly protein OpcA